MQESHLVLVIELLISGRVEETQIVKSKIKIDVFMNFHNYAKNCV